MKTLKSSLYVLACLLAFSCTKENSGTQSKKNRDPKVETTSITVSAELDVEFKKAALAEDENYAKFLAPVWTWEASDSVRLIYSYGGVEGICISKSIKIDDLNNSLATFSFDKVPVSARIVRMEVGSEGVQGQIVSETAPISKSSVYEIAAIDSAEVKGEISGVKFASRCSYFDVYVPTIRTGSSTVPVERVDLVGININGSKEVEQTISLDYSRSSKENHYMFAVNNLADSVRFDITVDGGTSKLVDIEDMPGISKFYTVRDPADLSDVITVKVEAFLDPTFKAEVASEFPEAAGLCSWNTSGDILLNYTAGAFKGSDTPESVTPDPSDASKANLVFKNIPKKAKVVSISYGGEDAFGAKAIEGKMGEDFKYFTTDIAGTAGTASFTGIILKNQASYVNIDAKTLKIDDSYKTTTGVSLEGDDIDAVTFDASEVQNKLWACISNQGGAFNVKASYDGGKAILKRIENAGKGTSKVFAANGENPEKEVFSTVLYEDGTLMINESGFDHSGNVTLHGSAVKTYDAWDGTNVKYDAPNGEPSDIPWYNDRGSIKMVMFGSLISPSTMKFWFKDHTAITYVDTKNLDMSKCETIKECFSGCTKLATIDVSVWKDLQKLVNMDNAFYNCSSLKVIDVKPWACTKLQSMKGAFSECSSLKELDFSSWNVGDNKNFTDMTGTFKNTKAMKNLDCTGIHPVNVTCLSQTFYYCGNAASGEVIINISGWVINDLSNKVALQNTFSCCNRVKVLDCSGFNTRNCPDCQNCFRKCEALVTIYASDDFTLPSTCKSAKMFESCKALVGGNGTAFDASEPIDMTYAHVDKPGQKGYFTAK